MKISLNEKEIPVVGKPEVERTDPFAGEFSASALTTAQCLRKFYYSKILGIQTPGKAVPLAFGAALHEAIAKYYIEQNLPLQDRKRLAMKAFAENWQTHEVVGDSKRNPINAMQIIDKYADTYKRETANINLIEIEQWLSMPNGTMILVKLDRVDEEDGYTLVDTKSSTMSLTDWYFRQFENNFQMLLYLYAIQEIFETDCDNIMIDAIKVPYNGNSKSPNFVRRTFTYTEKQKEEALATYIELTDDLRERIDTIDKDAIREVEEYRIDRQSFFPCNQFRCADYGGCSYFPLCRFGMKDSMVQEVFMM